MFTGEFTIPSGFFLSLIIIPGVWGSIHLLVKTSCLVEEQKKTYYGDSSVSLHISPGLLKSSTFYKIVKTNI